MKRLIFICLLFSQLANSANWEFKVIDAGSEQSSNFMFLPMFFDNGLCRFDFSEFNGQTYISSNITVPSACNNDTTLVVDGYSYLMASNVQFFLNEDEWSSYEAIDLGTCSRAGGGSIPTGYPKLVVDNYSFKVSASGGHSMKNIGGALHFFFNTFHGDVVCSNGIPIDLIYKGGFDE